MAKALPVKLVSLAIGVFLTLLSPPGTRAAGPANVLVVVNGKSALSRAIADYYTTKRAIPKQNVCSIDVTEGESVSRDAYDRSIAAPIADCLRSRGLVESILYIVMTQGVPMRIKGTFPLETGTNSSVDSELCLLYADLHGAKHRVEGSIANPFFRQGEAIFRHPQFPIYLVTRLAAYDLPQVKAMIDRSLSAKNTGNFILDLRSSEDDGGGNEWLRNAAILLPEDRVVLEESTKVSSGQKRVIGYASWGSNDSNRKERWLRNEWLPGAIATEYVSTNARTFVKPPDAWNLGTWRNQSSWYATSPQSLTADYIAEGATGASGHVDEPYLTFTPRPDFVFPAYLRGRNLAESFYVGIPALSWQNVVIGDPLCSLNPIK